MIYWNKPFKYTSFYPTWHQSARSFACLYLLATSRSWFYPLSPWHHFLYSFWCAINAIVFFFLDLALRVMARDLTLAGAIIRNVDVIIVGVVVMPHFLQYDVGHLFSKCCAFLEWQVVNIISTIVATWC